MADRYLKCLVEPSWGALRMNSKFEHILENFVSPKLNLNVWLYIEWACSISNVSNVLAVIFNFAENKHY